MPNKKRKGKWQPFDALEGYQRSLRQTEYEKGKVTKPTLSEDALDDLNHTLMYAGNNQLEVLVEYYKEGYRHLLQGSINDIDHINGKLKIDNEWIILNMVLKISLVDKMFP